MFCINFCSFSDVCFRQLALRVQNLILFSFHVKQLLSRYSEGSLFRTAYTERFLFQKVSIPRGHFSQSFNLFKKKKKKKKSESHHVFFLFFFVFCFLFVCLFVCFVLFCFLFCFVFCFLFFLVFVFVFVFSNSRYSDR